MKRNLSRRDFLAASGVLAGLGLVGCSGDNGGSSQNTTSGDSSTTSDTTTPADSGVDERICADADLIAAAQAEGELIVYGSCEEDHVRACVENFEKIFGIKTSFQRLSTGEVQAKIDEENGNPSADVWFGGTTDPYNEASVAGLLEPYDAKNASHLISDVFKSTNNDWYGIYKGILGFFYNTEECERLGLDAPADWPDLLDAQYNGNGDGLIWLSNYNTAGTAKLVVNTVIQKYGHDEGIQYLVDLHPNIQVYTKSGSGPSKNVGTGECAVGIGFLHDAIFQIADNGYDNVDLVVPSSGATYEVGATAILKGCKHPNAAKLWIEYALSPACVERAQEVGAYQFLVIDDAKQPELATQFGLDPNNVMEYDFEDAKNNTSKYVEEVMAAIAAAGYDTGEDKFKTE